MGAFGGLYAFQRRPLPAGTGVEIDRLLSRYGSLGSTDTRQAQAALCVRHDESTRELQECAQAEVGTVSCSWNGRIDNRSELQRQLETNGSQQSNAALAVSVYGQHGVDGFSQIIGDWSVALFDRTRDELVLARDYYGARGLFYASTRNAVHWSTSLAALVQRLGAYEDLDDEYIAAEVMGLHMPNRTPYRQVQVVPPGTAMIWSSAGIERRVTFWSPPDTVPSHAPSEYASALRQLFSEAVKCRLCYPGELWAELSGGLDSSAVVCMADHLIRTGAVDTTGLELISFYAEGSVAADERPFIQTVEAHVGRQGHHLSYDAHARDVNPKWGWVTPAQRDSINFAICQTVSAHGGSTLLTGDAGDQVMGNMSTDSHDIAAELKGHRFGEALRQAREQARRQKILVYGPLVDAAGILFRRASTRRRMMAERLRLFGAERGPVERRVLDALLVNDSHARLWIQCVEKELRFMASVPDLTKAALLLDFRSDETSRSVYECEGISAVHPMTHRPLVEFILGLPSTSWHTTSSPRALMREAFAPFMPKRIVQRKTKGDPSPAIMRDAGRLATDWLPRLDDLALVRRGYVNRERLKRKLEQVSHAGCQHLMPLPMLMRMERWFAVRDAQLPQVESATQKGGDTRDLQRTDAAVHRLDRFGCSV